MLARNMITLMGRLTKDPEVKTSDKGGSPLTITTFSLAVQKRVKSGEHNEADYFDCVAFGKTGETIGKMVHKGDKMLVNGEMHQNSYTNKDGETKRSWSVTVDAFDWCESKGSGGKTATPATAKPAPAPKVAEPTIEYEEEEVPW